MIPSYIINSSKYLALIKQLYMYVCDTHTYIYNFVSLNIMIIYGLMQLITSIFSQLSHKSLSILL